MDFIISLRPKSTSCTERCPIIMDSSTVRRTSGHSTGPLLFLLYVNDITDNISSVIRLFANDCILYQQIRTPGDCTSLQQDITRLYNWSLTWQMVLNTKKCHFLSISRKRDRPTITYTLGTEKMSVVESYPYIGVTVSSDLRWHHHINTISNKAARTLNFIRRNIEHLWLLTRG